MDTEPIENLLRFRLEDLRSRLLNLSTSNKLLSTKFSDRTRSHVRVVDELPDVLYEKLLGNEMTFKSLPPLEEQPPDEKTLEFRNALENARLTDADHLAGLKTLEEKGLGEDSGELYELERKLKDRVRNTLGLPPRQADQRNLSLPAHARLHGVNPDYELPTPNDNQPDGRWVDPNIQLLLLPEQGERTLSHIADQARSLVHETGVDTLYMAFGFLEWKEALGEARVHYAPLLLLPVYLKRERWNGQYIYRVGATRDDPEANITLAEKLKQDFFLALPEYGEDEKPESYWQRITNDILGNKPDWRVRRWVAIGIFPFARMAMYHDLDPDKWDILAKPLVGQILGGTEVDGGDLAPDHDVDDPEVETLTPILIADTDAAQHSAVIDAVKGRSFAIKGPPGTGKSQTITNIIGAAVHERKSVLFVAEKSAALEVVYNRLFEASLGEFCLELHSYKASRKEVLESLRKRLEVARRAGPADLQTVRENLREVKEELRCYVNELNRPYGNTGVTVQQLLWHTRKAIDRFHLPSELTHLWIERPYEIEERQLENACKLLGKFADAYEACVSGIGGMKEHPWRGFGNKNVTLFDLEELIENARAWELAATTASTAAQWFVERFGGPQEASTTEWERTSATLTRAASLLAHEAKAGIVQHLATEEARQRLTDALDKYKRVKALDQELSGKVDVKRADPTLIARAAADATQLSFDAVTVGEVPEASKQAAAACSELAAAIERVKRTAAHLGCQEPLLLGEIVILKVALSMLAGVPEKALRMRTLGMQNPACLDLLEDTSNLAQQLRKRGQELSERYHIDKAGDPETLEAHAQRLEEDSVLRFLARAWWRSRKIYRLLCRQRERASSAHMAKAFRTIAGYLADRHQFNEDQKLRALLGHHFRGTETDFENLFSATRFVRDAKRRFLVNAGFESQILQALLNPTTDLAAVVEPGVSEHIEFIEHAARSHGNPASIKELCEAAADSLGMMEALEITLGQVPGLANTVGLRELRSIGNAVAERQKLASEVRSVLTMLPPQEVRQVTAAGLEQSLQVANAFATLSTNLPARHFAEPAIVAESANSAANVAHLADKMLGEFRRVTEKGELDESAFFDGISCRDTSLETVAARAKACAAAEQALQQMAALVRVKAHCEAARLGEILALGLEAGVSPGQLANAYVVIVRRSQARDALGANEGALQQLTGNRQAHERLNFQQLDRRLRDLARLELRASLLARNVPPGIGHGRIADYTDRNLIEHEVHKQRGHIPLRDLFTRASNAILALKPCFLMSPQSVAQYLPRNIVQFDIIVIDEASQMKPEEAIGALARAKNQAIIVGDENQLPPTDFFQRALAADIEDEDYAQERVAEESILEKALAAFRPARDLRWHYRSRHSGLIAFSNRQFYDDRLIVFPSAHEGDDKYGVTLVKVDGLYGGGTNPSEANAIVEAALKHMRTRPRDSLGLAAMNQPQRELIREELDRAISLDPAAQQFVAHWLEEHGGVEQLFVKNLENVQGDERDVIMISTVYGPTTPGGPVAQRFGPINGINGHRRLNVLFTRAKKQTIVFTSMTADNIKVDGNPHRGVKVFRDYLSYAATGILESSSGPDGLPESPFEEWIIERIKAMGCEAVPQVGVFGYRIDIAVRHPAWPWGYIMGIECDGATYHSARSVRERDRLRQEVLEGLGWKLYRIWSTDWFHDPAGETAKLRLAIQKRLEELSSP